MSEFQTATENFLKWFKSVCGEFRDDLLEITDLRSRGAGRGIRERAPLNMSKKTNFY
jgi:SET domain-containing protein 6